MQLKLHRTIEKDSGKTRWDIWKNNMFQAGKILIIGELTVPWDYNVNNVEETHVV